jgi:hypothetical protein
VYDADMKHVVLHQHDVEPVHCQVLLNNLHESHDEKDD